MEAAPHAVAGQRSSVVREWARLASISSVAAAHSLRNEGAPF